MGAIYLFLLSVKSLDFWEVRDLISYPPKRPRGLTDLGLVGFWTPHVVPKTRLAREAKETAGADKNIFEAAQIDRCLVECGLSGSWWSVAIFS